MRKKRSDELFSSSAPLAPTSGRHEGLVISVAAMCCAAIAAFAHSRSLQIPFVYDDFVAIVENPTLRAPHNFISMVLWSRFRPIVNLSYAVDAWLFGVQPYGFHVTNLALHALNTALVFWIGHQLFDDAAVVQRTQRPSLAWPMVVATLFAVHPMLTQAVGYAAARSEVLSAFFSLCSILTFRLAFGAPTVTRVAAACMLFVAGLLSKESAAAVPFVVWLWRSLLVPKPDAKRTSPVDPLLPFLMGAAFVAAIVRVGTLVVFEGPLPRSPWENWLIETTVIWRYVALFIWPSGQTLMHTVDEVSWAMAPQVLLAIFATVVVAFVAWRIRRREPMIAFGAAWFWVTLLPSSSFVPLNEPMSEHRTYAASLGLFLVACACMWRLARSHVVGAHQTRVAVLTAMLVYIVLLPLTWARSAVWSDPSRLWHEAAVASPRVWAAQFGYGQVLIDRGDCERAIVAFERAIALDPRATRAHNDQARCLAMLGRTGEAHRVLQTALQVDPKSAQTWANMAALALTAGRGDVARQYMQRAIDLEPSNEARRRGLEQIRDAPADANAPWPPAR